MRTLAVAALAALLTGGAIATAAGQAPPAPAAQSAAKFSVDSTIGQLIDNSAAKAVLVKYIPDVVNHPDIEMGRDFPLSGIAQFVPELTPELLAKIDADLKKL